MVKTLEIDADTMELLKKIKLRPDETLASVIGRLAVYCYDWEPLNEEFIKKMENARSELAIPIEDIDEFFNDIFCDDCNDEFDGDEDLEDDSTGVYIPFDPKIIPEVNKLMTEKPVDMPEGISFDEFIKNIPVVEDKSTVIFNDNIVELFEGFYQRPLDISMIHDQASYFPDKEEVLSYGSIHEIQRILREDNKPVGSFKTVEQFNEHLKYLPKEKIIF
jgi:hypothetical protein